MGHVFVCMCVFMCLFVCVFMRTRVFVCLSKKLKPHLAVQVAEVVVVQVKEGLVYLLPVPGGGS